MEGAITHKLITHFAVSKRTEEWAGGRGGNLVEEARPMYQNPPIRGSSGTILCENQANNKLTSGQGMK